MYNRTVKHIECGTTLQSVVRRYRVWYNVSECFIFTMLSIKKDNSRTMLTIPVYIHM